MAPAPLLHTKHHEVPFLHIIFTLVHISYLYYTFNQGLGHQPAWYSVRSSEWERLPWTNLLFKQKVTKTLKEKVQSQQTHNTILTKNVRFCSLNFCTCAISTLWLYVVHLFAEIHKLSSTFFFLPQSNPYSDPHITHSHKS